MPTIAGQTTNWNVFHYTDLNALINIIHKDCIILRATNVLYQNDPHEIVEGVNIVNKIEKDQNIVAGAFRSYYITSFSANEDNLSMWGMYAANGNGCAIAFDYDMLAKSYEIMARCISVHSDSCPFHAIPPITGKCPLIRLSKTEISWSSLLLVTLAYICVVVIFV